MFLCKVINFLYAIFPLRIWRYYLIRWHRENCFDCQERLINRSQARSWLIQESDVGGLDSLWSSNEITRIEKISPASKPLLEKRMRWVLAAAFIVFVALASLLIYQKPKTTAFHDKLISEERFRINHLKVAGEPVNAVLFHPHDSETIIIWIDRNL